MFGKMRSRVSSRVLRKLVVTVEGHSARSVGIAGLDQDCDAAAVAEGLAQVLNTFGKKTLLIRSATCLDDSAENSAQHRETEAADEGVPVLKLSAGALVSIEDSASPVLLERIRQHEVTVVELPFLYRADEQFSTDIAGFAPFCDIVLIVVKTAHRVAADIEIVAEYCRVSKLNVVGLILNDRGLYFRRFITNC